MGVVLIVRQGVLILAMLCSVVVLGISADLIPQSQLNLGFTATFLVLDVAVAAVSLVTLPVMFVIDILRRGAFTSMIVVELSWLSALWVLWVAAAGETVIGNNAIFLDSCIYLSIDGSTFFGVCEEVQVLEALTFLNFIILVLYTSSIGVMAMIAANRGQSIWLSSVRGSFGSPANPVQHPMIQYGVPVAPQHQAYSAGPLQYTVASGQAGPSHRGAMV